MWIIISVRANAEKFLIQFNCVFTTFKTSKLFLTLGHEASVYHKRVLTFQQL